MYIVGGDGTHRGIFNLSKLAEERGLPLEPDAVQYLLPRAERSAAALERLVAEIDRLMHRDRVTRTRAQLRHTAPLESLPDGAFILHDDAPQLVWDMQLLRYTPGGYTAALPRGTGPATVLTPASTVTTLAAGYRPAPHHTATQQHP